MRVLRNYSLNDFQISHRVVLIMFITDIISLVLIYLIASSLYLLIQINLLRD